MIKSTKILLIFLTIVMFLSSCLPNNFQKKEAPICVGLPDDIVSLDPAATKDTLSEAVARCIFSTLYTFDDDLQLTPCLAESYERTSELEWVFKLKSTAVFHDGSPLTAEDVQYSVERAMSLESVDKSLMVIDSIELIDTYTFKVITKQPYVDLPSLFVRVSTSVMSKKSLQNQDYDLNDPIGSGPFKLIQRNIDESIQLERFDQYFLLPAKTKYLNFVIEPSEQSRTSGLLNNQLDVVFRISSYDCNYLNLNEDVKVYTRDSTKMEIMMFNPDFAPLNDINVRKAIAHAIHKENLVDNVLDGYGSILNSLIPPPLMGSIDADTFSYNPQLAKDLLKEAGYENGFNLTALTFDVQRKKVMEYVKIDLSQVGIELNYEFLQLSEYLDAITNNQHASTVMSWTSNVDPDNTFSQLYSKEGSITVNHSKYSDARVEAMIIEARKENDPMKREKIYQEANQIICDSYFFLPLYQPKVLVAASKNIDGVRINPQGLFHYESLFRTE